MYFGLFCPLSLNSIRKIVYHYGLGHQQFGVEEQRRWLWPTLTGVVWLPCCRTNILSIGTHCSSRRFKVRTQRNIIMFTQRKGKKNQAPLALVLTFSHSWKASHSTLKNSWHKFLVYVEFAATSFHSNNCSYILLFYGMHASLPFLSKGIFYCRGEIMTV